MRLVGAESVPLARGLGELPGKVNYLIGSDPEQWRLGVPLYGRVAYDGVYPGIDLVYHGNAHHLEYDFIVAPGADPRAIGLRFEGASVPEIDAHGNLVLRTAGGEVRLSRPIVFQEREGARHETGGAFVLREGGHVGFWVGPYDTTRPLVIDPVIVYRPPVRAWTRSSSRWTPPARGCCTAPSWEEAVSMRAVVSPWTRPGTRT
jgi:hypothetical protein